MRDMNKKYLPLTEVAEHFSVSYPTVARWCDLGMIEFIRLPSGTLRIPASEIERLEHDNKISTDQSVAG